MSASVPKPRKISDFKPLFDRVAQTSHYQVNFSVPWPVKQYLQSRGVDKRFIGESVGLLCKSASIPGSAFATAEITGNFQGVTEKMAHTRMFQDISLTFYVDYEYKSLKFLEHWMEFISSGSEKNPLQSGYHYRMRYPKDYKSDSTTIVKFDRDYNKDHAIEYGFLGLFPRSLNSIPVQYGDSQVLEATCNFTYDRYVCGKTSSKSWFLGIHNNLNGFRQMRDSIQSSNETTGKSTFADNGLRNDAPAADWNTKGIEASIPNAEQVLTNDFGMSKTAIDAMNELGNK